MALLSSPSRRLLLLQALVFFITALHELHIVGAAATAAESDVRWAIATGDRTALEPWEVPSTASSDAGPAVRTCAFDAVHIQAQWRLPPDGVLDVAHTIVREARRTTTRPRPLVNDKRELPDNTAAATLRSTIELLTVDTAASSASDARVIATAGARDHSLTSVLADDLVERLQWHAHELSEAADISDDDDDGSDTSVAIACEFDRAFCTPKLVGIRLPDLVAPEQRLAANHCIVLEFAQPTNRPHAANKQQIDRFVRFGAYVGDELAGDWSADGRVLTIRVLAVTDAQLKPREALMHGLLQTELQSIEYDSLAREHKYEAIDRIIADVERGGGGEAAIAVMHDARFRIEPRGVFRVRLTVASSAEPERVLFAAESPPLRVVACSHEAATTLVLQRSLSSAASSSASERTTAAASTTGHVDVAEPSFSLNGVLSLSGSEGFVLPHAAIRMRDAGSWSLSFWVFATQSATGAFRSLVFNGDGAGEMRTPSVWWKPDENRFVLRASTSTGADAGADSKQSIATHRWVHLALRFRNCSAVDGSAYGTSAAEMNISSVVSDSEQCADARAAARPWLYAISLFVDGAKDSDVLYFAPAIANSGPLHVGKDAWTDGMRGFVSSLRVFPAALSDAQLQAQYAREREQHVTFTPLRPECVDQAASAARSGDEDGSSERDARLRATRAPQCRGPLETAVPVVQWHAHPALQIAYLVQRCGTPQRQRWRESDSDASLAPSSSSALASLQSLQDRAYADARRVLEQTCDRSGWDVLLEAAELGHAGALRDVGKAHLYGALELPATCTVPGTTVSPLRVRQDFARARAMLEAALQRGAWDVGKSLALLVAVDSRSDARSNDGDNVDGVPLASLTTGLYHLSAVSGCKDAFAVLARRYAATVEATLDAAVFHYLHAALDAAAAYHAHGKQPLHEMDRLYDALQRDVAQGQRGDDDELIQYQRLRAEQGDVAAIAAMGDLYYWGARGVGRDHTRAHAYFERAARAGHVSAQSALAGMLLKGEGAAQDNASAIAWYERAAAANHTRALNGLGFVHFHGTGGVTVNRSRALALFERAAANEEDGDSVFNAGYCHALGLGTRTNVTRAMQFYDVAARKFGHFDAILELGKLWTFGAIERDESDDGEGVVTIVVERDAARALPYLKAASDGGGTWGASVRRGFDWFLAGDFGRAAVRYHEAEELGYPVATSNLAFLYDQRLLTPPHGGSESDSVDIDAVENDDNDTGGDSLAREQRALAYLVKTSHVNDDREVLVRIGDYHFYGLAGLRTSAREALHWYSRASAEGVAAGAYSVGYMHEHGVGVRVNLQRAQRYYERVLELASDSREVVVVVRLALARVAARRWLRTHAPALLATMFESPAADSHLPRTSSSSERRSQFSELGGIALESLWQSGRTGVVALLPLALALGLVLLAVAYSRRSGAA